MSWDGAAYQGRFDRLAAAGVNVHGEADLVASLGGRRVLDAGCGTGRVARELARRGLAVVGVDRDPSMLAEARRLSPELVWREADMADVDLGERFDVVVMAGNVPLFTPAERRHGLVTGCARHLAPGGLLVAGFQSDQGYDLASYDHSCADAGLVLTDRWSTWDGDDWGPQATYAVSIHRRPEPVP